MENVSLTWASGLEAAVLLTGGCDNGGDDGDDLCPPGDWLMMWATAFSRSYDLSVLFWERKVRHELVHAAE